MPSSQVLLASSVAASSAMSQADGSAVILESSAAIVVCAIAARVTARPMLRGAPSAATTAVAPETSGRTKITATTDGRCHRAGTAELMRMAGRYSGSYLDDPTAGAP